MQEDNSPGLSAEQVTHIQQVIRKFSYYAHAVDHTILIVLGELATKIEDIATE